MGLTKTLKIRLFGSFSTEWSDGTPILIRSSKHRALLALLATAANGTHSRTWLQETLWSLSGEEHGRASLRRALSDLRKVFGKHFDQIFKISNIDICLAKKNVKVIGDLRDGIFLQGLDIPEMGYKNWLSEKRAYYENGRSMVSPTAASGITPSVAIVPFLTRSKSPQEHNLSDMLALEVTRTLTRSKLVNVISHLSSRQFNQQILNLNIVRSTLGIDYLVYGSISFDGNRFQIDADFVETATGRIQWTRPFTGLLSEIVDGGNNVVRELSNLIGQAILSASVELARSKPLPDVESHALMMSSITFMHQHKLASFSKSRAHLEELIRRTPEHSALHAWLGKWYILSIAQLGSISSALFAQSVAF